VNQSSCKEKLPMAARLVGMIALTSALFVSGPVFAQQSPQFTTGNLVVAVEGCGVYGGTCTAVPNGTGTETGNSSSGGYGDNQAAPLTLFQYAPIGTTSAVYVNSFVLPQTASGANFPVSGEYGSSSEGTLQLSGSGRYLTIMGYGVNAAAFNANPPLFGAAPSNALGQSGSLTGQSYTPVPRVLALIDANGNVNSSAALYNIFNTNNPRSAYTLDGTTAYVSGQGSGCDMTGGVFYIPQLAPNMSPTAITGGDALPTSSCVASGYIQPLIAQDTRTVQIYGNTLYISADSTEGKSNNRSLIGTLGTPPATTLFVPTNPPTGDTGGPNLIPGFGNTGGTGKVTITTGANSNGNGLNTGLQINISPSNYFFANASTLYVADTGNTKQTSANSTLGDGGLQKWVNSSSDGSGTWSLAYTLHQGLPLVANSSPSGTTGLYGLTGTVSGNTVELFVTNATILDLDPTYLYGITDTLSFTTASQTAEESFTQLAAAPADSNFKGVSFTPTVPAQIIPTINWPAPAAITFGSALSSSQLDATASIPGTFVYSPPAGTVLQAGANQTLSVTFTPTDTTDYATANASTTITVNPATATPANLVVTRVLTRSGGEVVVQLTISNTGQTAAANVVLTGVKVGSDSATPLPQALGTIAAGASTQATVSVPDSVGASGAASSIAISGTYTGSTFSSSARITLP
jgi:hypothetical protein